MATRQRGKRGQGSVYQRSSDGRWCVKLAGVTRYPTENTEKAAEALRLKLRADLAAGKRIHDPTARLLADLLEEWLSQVVEPVLSYRTYMGHEASCRLYIAPALGRVRLSQLDDARCRRFINSLAAPRADGTKLGYYAVRNIRRTLIAVLNHAVRAKMIPENPASGIPLPRMAAPPPPPRFQEGQAKALFDAFRAHPIGDLYILSLSTGIRPGEAIGLRRSNITYSGGVPVAITITGQVQWQKHAGDAMWQPYLVPPKTRASARTIPIGSVAAEAILRALVRGSQAWAHKEPPHPTGSAPLEVVKARRLKAMEWGLVFVTQNGTPYGQDTTRPQLNRLLKAHGLERVTPHKLRHLLASYLIDTGAVSVRTVADTLGHADPSVTLKIYTHGTDASMQRVSAAMDALAEG